MFNVIFAIYTSSLVTLSAVAIYVSNKSNLNYNPNKECDLS